MSRWYTEDPMGSGNLRLAWDGVGPLPSSFKNDCDFKNPARVVAKTKIASGEVSTVLLYLDHSYDLVQDMSPVVYESMVFGGEHDGECERYRSRAEALTGHAAMVARTAIAKARGEK